MKSICFPQRWKRKHKFIIYALCNTDWFYKRFQALARKTGNVNSGRTTEWKDKPIVCVCININLYTNTHIVVPLHSAV